MNPVQQFAADNPRLFGMLLGLMCGISAYSVFRCGMLTAAIRSDVAHAASEAMGG